MKLIYTTFFFVLFYTIISAQSIDTLTFYSNSFSEERTVYVHKSEYFIYKSESVKLPVIYILDGQHEWFVNPTLSDIEYLRYTHEIPDALVVVIPHIDRYKECSIIDLTAELPLDKFIVEELDNQLKKYSPSDFKMLIGHSFSASFSMYSLYKNPEYYSAIIVHSPLDEMDLLVSSCQKNQAIDKSKIYMSIGSLAKHKDFTHRAKYDELKRKYPSFFNGISTIEADLSSHTGLPIIATSPFLNKIFYDFSGRFVDIAEVNLNYELINKPELLAIEKDKIDLVSKVGEYYYPPEIAEFNGIASRYIYNGYDDYAIMVNELAIQSFPKYYGFYFALYEIAIKNDIAKAKKYLEKAEELVKTVEIKMPYFDETLEEIQAEKTKNGW
ncbi:esterase family protein [Saprospiraceae bacterium]|nr:esterase family protein [Saprospiraceae bacterium]